MNERLQFERRGHPSARERSALGMDGFEHIAIDGPAGSGKTTVARALAVRLNILYLDTGAMYRALAFLALRAGTELDSAQAMLALAQTKPIRAVHDPDAREGFRMYAGGERLGDELYAADVSRVVSVVAAQSAVREVLVEQQRAVAREGPLVMAGRDIGTVVLPGAALKVFLTASLDERVDRRLAELLRSGAAIDRPTLAYELSERDRLDETRETAPLRRAPGAVVLDSTGRAVDDVVDQIAALARAARSRGYAP